MTGGRFHALCLVLDSLTSRGTRLAGWLMLIAQALMNNEVDEFNELDAFHGIEEFG